MYARPSHLFIVSIALLVSACKKEADPVPGLRYVEGVPYYHFTAADQPWLQLQQGTEWRFENSRGYQRVYEVYQRWENTQAENRTLVPTGSFIGSAKLLNYYDELLVRVRRTDSLSSGGEFRFHRAAALKATLRVQGSDPTKSRLYVAGEWSEFVGNTDLMSDQYACRGLKFPQAAALEGPFQQLTIRGRPYTEVVTFTGTFRRPNCRPASYSFMQELYYDRQAGIVRMVSLSGEVWDRLP